MSKSPIHDVLISGYGPSGATLANLLGMRGFSVLVVDRATEVYDKPRAITADHEVMRVFQECGLADEIAAASVPHPGTDYLGLENQVIKRFYPAPPPQSLTWEPTWMFMQPALEASLRRGAERHAGVQTRLGHELLDFTQDDQGVTARLRAPGGERTTSVRARYLVACDGGRSTVRRLLQSTVEDLAFDEWWIVVDAWLRGETELPRRATQYCHPWRPGTFVIGPGDLRRWEIKMLPHESPELFEDEAHFQSVLSQFVDTSKIELWRKAIYRFHALVVDEWRDGRVFLMGDAAHQMPPFLGQGLCAGVRDAANLAWKLEAVEKQGCDPALLESYGEERKPHVRRIVAHAKEFGLIIGELDMAAARERDQRLGQALAAGTAETVRQKFIPGLQCGLIAKGGSPEERRGAGDVFVQPWVELAGRGRLRLRLDDVIGPRFALVATSAEPLSWLPETAAALWQRLDGCQVVLSPTAAPAAVTDAADFTHALEVDGLARSWFERLGARVALVRPDRYVFGVAADAEGLQRLLEQFTNAFAQTSDAVA